MSDYQLADQFLYESSQKSDTSANVSNNKRVVALSDKNQGSYQSGTLEIDSASQLMGSKGLGSLRDSYITVPYPVSMKNTGAAAMGAAVNRYCVGLKAGVWNVVDSLSFEMGNQSILSEADYKLYWNNIRAMTEWSSSDVQKQGADAFLSPDDWTSMSFSAAASSSGDGMCNNFTNTTASPGLLPEAQGLSENVGFINRVYYNPQPVSMISSAGVEYGLNSYGWPTTRSGVATTIAQQNGKGAFTTTGAAGTPPVLAAAAAAQVAGVWYHMLKIRLVDLHPIFKELDLVGNPQFKLKLKFNSGYCDIATTSTSMTLTSTTMTSGNTCPVMVASAATSNAMNGVLSASAGSIRVAFGPLQNNITPFATAGQYYPFTTARLYMPFYDIANPSAIINKPIKTIKFLDVYAQYFKQKAGLGVLTTQQNAPFTLQLSASLKNIKNVSLTPFAETSTGHFATANNTEQAQSPFDSAPWTFQPGSSIRNFQVQIGNDNVFSKTQDYDYESFNDEFRKLGAVNGGLTHEISNGLIDFQKWSTIQRVLTADCSRITNKDVPQSVQVSGVNGACQGTNLLVHVAHERELTYNQLTGEVLNIT
jgi:hypothetical protein